MTSPGIGAAGILGIAAEVIAPPVATSATPTAGGALTAGTYKYYITAIGPTGGETTVSNELTGTTAAGNLTLTLLWAASPGATGYKVYRTAAGGASNTELLLATLGNVLTYNDAAVGAPAGAFPTINSAGNPGVYVPPTKFVPFLSESLVWQQATVWRRPIRNTPGLVGAVPGNGHVEGDLDLEALSDCLPYFLLASRCTTVRTGSAPYTYTATPAPNAIPQRTLSITVLRNGQVFGYVGCAVTNMKLTVGDDEQLHFGCSIIGTAEASASVPVASWPTTTPFGAGQYSLQIPTATQVFDVDTFDFESNDNGAAQFRLKNVFGAQFVAFGESEATIKVDRDFLTRADYDAFKALTSQSITLSATKGAGESITVLSPVAFKDTYEVSIGSQGDLVRASIAYQCAIDGTGKHYQIVVVTPTELVS